MFERVSNARTMTNQLKAMEAVLVIAWQAENATCEFKNQEVLHFNIAKSAFNFEQCIYIRERLHKTVASRIEEINGTIWRHFESSVVRQQHFVFCDTLPLARRQTTKEIKITPQSRALYIRQFEKETT